MKPLTINDKLHLVIPIYEGEKITAYVHSAPISHETFEAHFLLIAETFSQIYSKGLGIIAGPRVASMMLRKMAEKSDDPGEALTLMNEIRRLTNVVSRMPHGWESVPFQDAADRKMLSDDDMSEVMNAIVFFTLASAMHRRQDLKEIMNGAAKIWAAQTSSSDFTAFVASLETSTGAAHTTKHPTQGSSVVF